MKSRSFILASLCLLGGPPAVFSAPTTPAVKPLPYGAVTLVDGPFKEHQELDHKVLLQMSPTGICPGSARKPG